MSEEEKKGLTKEKLAEMLNGREYTDEITREEELLAKEDNLVVIFGASDDLMCICGAENDELGAYDGSGLVFFDDKGVLRNDCEEEDCPYFLEKTEKAFRIDGLWNKDGYSWVYKTEIPHATFEIMEDGEKYCRGIVFCLDDLTN